MATKHYFNNRWYQASMKKDYQKIRGGSRTSVTSTMEHFVIIVNGWKPLTIITKSSTMDVAAVLDPPLNPVKVLRFPGALADDMHHDLRTLSQKFPDTNILDIDTNSCVSESSCVVLVKTLSLKTSTQNSLPQCKIIISSVFNRTDDSKASLSVENLNNHLNASDWDRVR